MKDVYFVTITPRGQWVVTNQYDEVRAKVDSERDGYRWISDQPNKRR